MVQCFECVEDDITKPREIPPPAPQRCCFTPSPFVRGWKLSFPAPHLYVRYFGDETPRALNQWQHSAVPRMSRLTQEGTSSLSIENGWNVLHRRLENALGKTAPSSSPTFELPC